MSLRRLLKQLHEDDSGATSTEYMMIMVVVVMPIALLYPVFLDAVRTYASRAIGWIGLPFP